MANCSPDVVWSVVKDTSAHLLKRKASRKSGMGKAGAQLTLEPNNLTGINSFKYSGLANPQAVDLSIAADTKGKKENKVQYSVKSAMKTNNPKQGSAKILLSKGAKRSANSIVKSTEARAYRSDLKADALARYTALSRSLKRKGDVVYKKRRGRN